MEGVYFLLATLKDKTFDKERNYISGKLINDS